MQGSYALLGDGSRLLLLFGHVRDAQILEAQILKLALREEDIWASDRNEEDTFHKCGILLHVIDYGQFKDQIFPPLII